MGHSTRPKVPCQTVRWKLFEVYNISMKLKYIGLSILLIVAAINFTRITLEIIRSSERLDNVKSEISSLGQEKEQLEKSIEYKNSDDFIEKTARNELNMAKPGESVYVVGGLTKDAIKLKEGKPVVTRQKEVRTLAMRIKNLNLWFELLF